MISPPTPPRRNELRLDAVNWSLHNIHVPGSGTCCLSFFDGLSLVLDGLEQFMERVSKLLHALVLQLLGHLIIRDADLFQLCKFGLSSCNVVFNAKAYLAVIAEVLDSLQRHGVYGLRTDQFLCIENVAVGRVLGAGAGPEWTLHPCARVLERLEARGAENALEVLIDQTRISNSRFPFE